VFVSCTRVLLVDIDHSKEIERSEIYHDELSMTERTAILKKLKIKTIICSGISEILHNMLQSVKISLTTGIAGEIDQVVAAYLSKKLNEPRFHMPGFKNYH
jgi:predicted Fe-Mo cluster-binding NifX family protein